MDIKKLLLCTDGEEQSEKAEAYALALAQTLGAELTALYAISPLLKKFTNEIYAVNRDECRAHLDRSLEEEGAGALARFQERARLCGVHAISVMLHGLPEEVIVAHAESGDYDMVILGSRLLRGWRERFESCNLPEKVFKRIAVPVLFVR